MSQIRITKKTVVTEEHYEYFEYAVQITRWLLEPIGAWPLAETASKMKLILHNVLIATTMMLHFFLMIPWITHIIVGNLSFDEIIKMTCPFIFLSTVILKYNILMYRQNQLRSCIDHIAEDWRKVSTIESREIMLNNAKLGRFLAKISVGFMYGSGLLYCTIPLIVPTVTDSNNVTIRALPNPCEFVIFNVQASPTYEIVYLFQFASSLTLYCVFCGTCCLTAKFVTHVCGQCQIVISIFENIIDRKDECFDDIDNRLASAVLKHLRVLRFVSDVDKVLNEICLAEFVSSSCNMCLLGYYVITDWDKKESIFQIGMYFFAFLSITFNIFIFCYMGELLVNQCQRVGITCYMIEWYRLSHKKALTLMLPIAMSDYPTELTAGKIVTLSLASFSSILKAALTYFNLLREVSTTHEDTTINTIRV